MKEYFEQEIESLKINLIKMASLVDEQVNKVIDAMEKGDPKLCASVKSRDTEVDAYDNLIQAQCENVLALFQPLTIDLRFIMSALMINNQLERCGDLAVNIAQRVKKTAEFHSLILESDIPEMGKQAKGMLKDAIDAFIQSNSAIALKVIENDENVDKLNKQTFKFLVSKMHTESKLIEPCAHLLVLSRHLERLADHATNIAENLVFYVEAKIIAHRKKLQDRGNIS